MSRLGGSGGLLGRRVIVLNASWLPVGVTNVRNALTLLFSRCDAGEPKSFFVDPKHLTTAPLSDIISPSTSIPNTKSTTVSTSIPFDDSSNLYGYIRTPTSVVRIPEAIVLSKYHGLSCTTSSSRKSAPLRFSRNALFARDRYRCGYCGVSAASATMTVEHVLPYSRGGPTTYENCVTACQSCNSRKGARTPAEAGMRIADRIELKAPKRDDRLKECARLFQQLVSRAQENDVSDARKD